MAHHDSAPGPRKLSARQLQDRAVDGAMWTMIHTVVSIPLAFGVNIVLARVLGAAGYGRLALLTAILEIAVLIAGAGVSQALLQFGAKAHAGGRHEEVRDLLSRTQGFRLLAVAPALTAIVLIFADVPLYLMVSACLFGVWLPAFTGGAAVCMTLENRTATAAKMAIGLNLVIQTAVLVTVLTARSPDAVWNARMIVAGLAPLLSLILISPIYRKSVVTPKSPFSMPVGFWKFALPIGASSIIANLVLSRSEVFVLQALSTGVEVGLYAMAFGLATHILAPAQALINPLTPAVSSLRETNPEKVGDALLRTVRISSSLSGAISAIGATTVACLVPLLYGQEFARANWLVLVLSFVASIIFLTSPLIPFVTSRLRAGRILLINIVSLIIGVALLIPFVHIWGAWGAVMGKAFMALTRLTLLLVVEKKSFDVRARSILRASAPTGIGVVVALVVFWAVISWDLAPLPSSLICLVGASVLYLTSLRMTRSGLTTKDASAISSRLPSRGRMGNVTARLIRPLINA